MFLRGPAPEKVPSRMWRPRAASSWRASEAWACPRAVQEQRAGVEDYAEKLAVASRRAEKMVKEFEELGAGEEGVGGWG